MKKHDNQTISDLLKLGETALTTLLGARTDMTHHVANAGERLARKMELVTREEFDAAFAMIKKARANQDVLEKRISQIEEKMNLSSPQKQKAKKQIRTPK